MNPSVKSMCGILDDARITREQAHAILRGIVARQLATPVGRTAFKVWSRAKTPGHDAQLRGLPVDQLPKGLLLNFLEFSEAHATVEVVAEMQTYFKEQLMTLELSELVASIKPYVQLAKRNAESRKQKVAKRKEKRTQKFSVGKHDPPNKSLQNKKGTKANPKAPLSLSEPVGSAPVPATAERPPQVEYRTNSARFVDLESKFGKLPFVVTHALSGRVGLVMFAEQIEVAASIPQRRKDAGTIRILFPNGHRLGMSTCSVDALRVATASETKQHVIALHSWCMRAGKLSYAGYSETNATENWKCFRCHKADTRPYSVRCKACENLICVCGSCHCQRKVSSPVVWVEGQHDTLDLTPKTQAPVLLLRAGIYRIKPGKVIVRLPFDVHPGDRIEYCVVTADLEERMVLPCYLVPATPVESKAYIEEFRSSVSEMHKEYLRKKGIPFRGYRKQVRRITHCYRCKVDLDSAIDGTCQGCDPGIVCWQCGACFCRQSHRRN